MYSRLHKIYENHRNIALLYHLLTGKLYRPSHFKVLFKDILNKREKGYENLVHCEAGVNWLFAAQNTNGSGGVSIEYSFSWGWRWPYPEVSGYIIPTLFDFAQTFPNSPVSFEARSRAVKIADWLIKIQLPDGSYQLGLYPTSKGSFADRAYSSTEQSAFETAQILYGLSRAYRETNEALYLNAALAAGDWLVRTQSQDGYWNISIQNQPRSFDSMIAWSLAELHRLSSRKSYSDSAKANLDWCLSRQRENGWFDLCSHTLGDLPWTHGIGYTLQGLLEADTILKEERYTEAVKDTAEVLLRIYSIKGFKSVYEQQYGFLPARFDERWRSRDKFTCLTGNAQISLVFSRLFTVIGDIRYLNAALKLNSDLKSLQNVTSTNDGIRGGIKGSHPIYGRYLSFRYPSWATKFFVDALISEERSLSMLRSRR